MHFNSKQIFRMMRLGM